MLLPFLFDGVALTLRAWKAANSEGTSNKTDVERGKNDQLLSSALFIFFNKPFSQQVDVGGPITSDLSVL